MSPSLSPPATAILALAALSLLLIAVVGRLGWTLLGASAMLAGIRLSTQSP